jgi:CHAT domain-containing protein
LRKEISWPEKLLGSLALAEIAERRGQSEQAISHLMEAAEIESRVLESPATQLARGNKWQIQDKLFKLLLEQGYQSAPSAGVDGGPRTNDTLAFRILEQSRYRLFRDFLFSLSSHSNLRPLAAEENRLLLRIEQASARLRMGPDAKSWEQLRRAYGDYEDVVLRSELARSQYELVREAQPAQLEAVQEVLDEETAIVEYLFAEESCFALVITGSRLQSVRLPVTKKALSAKVKLFRSLIFNSAASPVTRPSDAVWSPVATDLHNILIEPLEQTGAIAGARRLAMVPFGFLHDLPFAALARIEGGKARFLIEDYSIFYAPSATFFARAEDRAAGIESQPGKILSFGRNRSDEPGLPPLEFAVEEARAVAEVAGGLVRLDEEASETEMRRLARDFRFIHLAAHSVSEPHMPLLSRLKLQASGADDGDLTVREILDLDLRAELVTLGGCQTGQSYSSSGNEMGEMDRTGLIEAFLHAGARSVLASLLPISDRPTSDFMKTFYRNLLSMTKADALAQAQRAMIGGEHAHPRNWAPFILVGSHR